MIQFLHPYNHVLEATPWGWHQRYYNTFSHVKCVKCDLQLCFFVNFNSMSNLIVFMFNHFPVFIMRFNVRVVIESLINICEEGDFVIGSWLAHEWQTAKGHVRSTCLYLKSLMQGWILWVTRDLDQVMSEQRNSLPGAF